MKIGLCNTSQIMFNLFLIMFYTVSVQKKQRLGQTVGSDESVDSMLSSLIAKVSNHI